jgi:hypothetical protein
VLVHAPLQNFWLAAQAQFPDWQVCPPLQTLPHLPQFVSSELTCTHALPQRTNPALHWQVPAWQTELVEHAFPQAPQLSESFCTLMHWPLQTCWEGSVHAHLPDLQL